MQKIPQDLKQFNAPPLLSLSSFQLQMCSDHWEFLVETSLEPQRERRCDLSDLRQPQSLLHG